MRALRDGTGTARAWTPPPPHPPRLALAEALVGHGCVTALGVTTLRVLVCLPAQRHGCFVRPQPASVVLQ